MSRLRRRAALAALAALLGLSAAQHKPAEAPEPSTGPAEVVARLHDGTVVRKALLRDGVVIATRFGRLTVPAGEIRRIEFGRHLPAGAAREVEGLVKQLGSDDFKQREAAGKRLVALGPRAYPALQAAARGPDKELAARPRAAAEQVRKAVPAELLSVPEQDVVHTRDCVLAGRIEGEALKARTASLGELSLRLSELRSLHSAAVDRADVAVEAAQFGAGAGKWADSGVTVEAGVGLAVAASGRVDLVPAQAGQHVSGPAGYPAQGEGGYQAGTLLGRLGEDGPVFVVGQQFQGPSGRGGKLYLRVVPLANGTGPAGAYQVKVSSGPGVEAEGKGNAPTPRRRPGADSGAGAYRPPPCHPGCFPAGTPIRTPGGSQPIERLRAGDLVTTVGPDGAAAPRKVASVFVTKNRLVEVRTEAGNLVTTETQPLALAGGGLRAAGELKAGDRVFRWGGGRGRVAVAVRSVSLTGREEPVFNLILGGGVVFVADGFLVRSKPPAPAIDPAKP
ncbi:MAG TPA: Hint domain-containing protein [Gemmataceae bacterium]|nr:Hint domain-containing protein [Gemmataceae bacterium]